MTPTKKIITNDKWFEHLIEDCKAIVTEASFTSRWSTIEGYHNLGKRIIEDEDNFKKLHLYGGAMTKSISRSLGCSQRTIQKSIQFYTKYPDLSLLPEGKNVSWFKVCNKYLPEPKEKPPCEHLWILVCKHCGKRKDT